MAFTLPPVVTFDDVFKLKDDPNVLIIDVREPSELQETGSIPRSINIPLNDVESVLKDLPNNEFEEKYGRTKPDFNFPIIFSCRSGKRAGQALEIAKNLGYKNLSNYKGSWLDWAQHIKEMERKE
ncbi:rhodanese domain-containing protein CG4456-like isoform X2 [Aethina tumida]|nr:rhodanese domain-containing protein CG4456-like isoform X2 [Aethina tumida]